MANKSPSQFTRTIDPLKDGDWLGGDDSGDSNNTGKIQAVTAKTYINIAFQGTGREFVIPDEIFDNESSGVKAGGALSVNGGDNTKFDVATGTGRILDVDAQTFGHIQWVNSPGFTPMASDGLIYVYVNSGNFITQTITKPDAAFRRDNVNLGVLEMISGVVARAISAPDIVRMPSNQIYDVMKGIGPFLLDGNEVTANGGNVKIDKAVGRIFEAGSNFQADDKIPHATTQAVAIPATFQMTTQTAFSGVNVTDLDVANYDVGGVVTSIPGSSNRATNFRVYLYPDGIMRIQYGQVFYQSLSDAIVGLSRESFVIHPELPDLALLIAFITATKGATDLSDPLEAHIAQADRFGQSPLSASVTSLNAAYNNGATPQIFLNSTRAAVELVDNLVPLAGPLSRITDITETEDYFVADTIGVRSDAFYTWFPFNVLYVAPSGAQYTTIGGAIVAAIALTPSVSNQVLIRVARNNTSSGYSENIDIPAFVHVIGETKNTFIDGLVIVQNQASFRNFSVIQEGLLSNTDVIDISAHTDADLLTLENIDIFFDTVTNGVVATGIAAGTGAGICKNIRITGSGTGTSTINGFLGNSGTPSNFDVHDIQLYLTQSGTTTVTGIGYVQNVSNAVHFDNVTGVHSYRGYVGVDNVYGGNITDKTIFSTTVQLITVGYENWTIYTGTGVGGTIITMPASPRVGEEHRIQDGGGDASAFPITVNGGGNNINGAATQPINADYGFLNLAYDGTQWLWS